MLESFREQLKTGAATPADARLLKQFVADSVKAEGDGQSYTFTISTGVVDRDRDKIAVAGWHVDAFLKSGGPVLYAHQSRELPIGKASWVKVSGDQLKARVEFAPKEANPMAEMVRQLVKFGALKATSVGFRPLPGKAAWNEERNGIDFNEQELLEFSIVPVPANPEALIDAKAAGIDVAPLETWAKSVLVDLIALPLNVMEDFGDVFKAEYQKRGRVLSAANEARIREARDAGSAIGAALDEVLSQMPEAPAEPKAVLMLAPPAPKYVVDPAVVAAAVRDAVSASVREQVNAARGRLD